MPRSRVLAFAAATAAVSLATLLVASPAQAATLPVGQRITVVDDFYGDVWTADPVTAVLTFVGEGVALGEFDFMTAVDVNDDGFGYAISTDDAEGHGLSYLYAVDASAGTITDPEQISIPLHQSLALGCESLDFAPDGTLYTTCYEAEGENTYSTVFGTLDPVTGDLTPLLHILEDVTFTAVATNPVTGVLWVFDFDFVSYQGLSYTWDPETETLNYVAQILLPVFAADFDRDGQLFVTIWDNDVQRPLLSVLDPDLGDFTEVDYYTIQGQQLENFQAPPLTVWGKAPVLPATGPVDVLPFGLGAVLLLLAGGAFVATQRMERRRA
jgi:hypothetical protein